MKNEKILTYLALAMKTVNGVTIGDQFKYGKHTVCEVVDFHKVTSETTGELIRYICIAKSTTGLSTNKFEIPFATVLRNKVL